jgi:hypothetical protein
MVKEAISLSKKNNQVTVIFCPISIWGDSFDKDLLYQNSQIKWIRVGAHPKENRMKYYLARIRKKRWDLLYHLFGNICNAALKSSVLYAQDLEAEAKNHKADLYIGHNLGAISAVVKSAKKFNSIASFDFEDFHRGEDLENTKHWKKTIEIENKYVPCLNSATTASPLITKAYQEFYSIPHIKTILNVFTNTTIDYFINSNSVQLRLFWFSQTIGMKRGLEFVLSACAKVVPQPKITLLGNCTDNMKDKLYLRAVEVGFDQNLLEFKLVVPEIELPKIASQHHIGLCTEDPGTLNRDLCLTNKIFTYMLGKNALLLSNTLAQNLFLDQNHEIGQIFNLNNISQITEKIQLYQDNRILLDQHRSNSLRMAKEKYNWEYESQILTQHYHTLLET